MDEVSQPMRWVVGVGPRDFSVGALLFARWLRHCRSAHPDAFEVVHAVSDPATAALAQRAISETLRDLDVEAPSVESRIHDLEDPVAALEDSCVAFDADGLIIGRRAGIGDGGWPRLGRSARRLIRSHEGPLVVVPPDWLAPQGRLPIVVASDLGPDSEQAERFGAELGRHLALPWTLLHVVGPAGFTMYGLEAEATEIERRRAEARVRAEARAAAACVPAAAVVIESGEVVDSVVAFVTRQPAALLVTGSRRLGVLGRLFSASVGSELAATAPCPVAISPPAAHPDRVPSS